jgi:hypothetical protein
MRRSLAEWVRAGDPRVPPANPPRKGDGYATQGEVLLHVYEELAQHRGQLEITRDVLVAAADARGAPGRDPG